MTYNASQLKRWPLEISTRAGRQRVRIGPPQRLLTLDRASVTGHMAFCRPDQDRVAIAATLRGVSLVDLETRPRVIRSWPTPTANFIAASPDGRWVATGNHSGLGFQVWDTLRNVEAHLWPMGGADVAFSPDGRWFVSATGGGFYTGAECVFWEVGTWQRGPSIPLERTSSPSQLAFSDDGRVLAVQRTMTEVLLLDPRDLHELARLQSREPTILATMRFSPDGSLLVVGTSAGYLHVWDLRRIRARLAEMNLDWDTAPFSPSPAATTTEQPLEVEIRLDPASLVERASYDLEIQDYRRARTHLEEALASDPDRPAVRRGLVSVLTNGPIAIRDLGRASELLRTAPHRDATNLAFQGDLGMILYRLGRYSEAVATLEPAIGAHPDASDRARWGIFLAMSQHHLGQSRAAQESYHRAGSDLAAARVSPAAIEEFHQLWSEADATFHIGSDSR
jgi:Tfp pilus assembly protein PilF